MPAVAGSGGGRLKPCAEETAMGERGSVPRAEIITKLNKETNAILSDPKVRAQIAEQGGTALSGSAADFGKLIAADTERWGKVVRFAGLRAD
jgi:tripartite-type tricarboxylate transporter receptor subunit TctC